MGGLLQSELLQREMKSHRASCSNAIHTSLVRYAQNIYSMISISRTKRGTPKGMGSQVFKCILYTLFARCSLQSATALVHVFFSFFH